MGEALSDNVNYVEATATELMIARKRVTHL